jgi:hypothetical protein
MSQGKVVYAKRIKVGTKTSLSDDHRFQFYGKTYEEYKKNLKLGYYRRSTQMYFDKSYDAHMTNLDLSTATPSVSSNSLSVSTVEVQPEIENSKAVETNETFKTLVVYPITWHKMWDFPWQKDKYYFASTLPFHGIAVYCVETNTFKYFDLNEEEKLQEFALEMDSATVIEG